MATHLPSRSSPSPALSGSATLTEGIHRISFEEARSSKQKRQQFLDQIVGEMKKEGSVAGIDRPQVVYDPSGELSAGDTAQAYLRFAPKETAREGGVEKVAALIKENQKKLFEDASKFAHIPLAYRRSGGGSILELGRGIAKSVYVNETIFSSCFSIDSSGKIIITGRNGSGNGSYLVSTNDDLKSLLHHEFQHVMDFRDGLRGPLGTFTYAQEVSESDFPHFMAFFELPAYRSQFRSFYHKMSRPLRRLIYSTSESLLKSVYLSPYRVKNPLLFACINEYKFVMVSFVNEFTPRIIADTELLKQGRY